MGGTKKRIRIASKRNRLRLKGDSPYVYLADADLLLPGKPFFGHMIRALAENARIGAIGLCCFPDRDHVSFASMMLRRRDFVEIGEIRDVAISCGCGYVVRKLEQAGLRVVPVKAETLKPKHLKTECDSKYSEYEEVRYQASPDGILDRTLLENTIRRYGTQFKLFIDG